MAAKTRSGVWVQKKQQIYVQIWSAKVPGDHESLVIGQSWITPTVDEEF